MQMQNRFARPGLIGAAPPPCNVLAVLGSGLDDTVVRLALALARESVVLVDLLLLVEAPATLPMHAYGEWLLARMTLPTSTPPRSSAGRRWATARSRSAVVMDRRWPPRHGRGGRRAW